MGLMDFFNKGVEKKVETKADKPVSTGAPVSQAQEYTIVSGDSLSKIAKHFYGDPMKWKTIYEANQDVIKDPDLIHPGQKIIIPKI